MRITAGGSGKGTLIFQGWQYWFNVENMTISGVGGQEVELEGSVYDLAKIEDFEGTYKTMAADIKKGGGLEGVWFKNEKGVRVHITSSNKDITIRLNSEGATVTLKE